MCHLGTIGPECVRVFSPSHVLKGRFFIIVKRVLGMLKHSSITLYVTKQFQPPFLGAFVYYS